MNFNELLYTFETNRSDPTGKSEGIYRVAGVLRDVQELREACDIYYIPQGTGDRKPLKLTSIPSLDCLRI